MALKPGWMPPRSPYSLLQEDLWPSEWLILVSCVLLNCTTRKQVEKVLPEFVKRWPGPKQFILADRIEVATLIQPLGFCRRRTVALMKMTNMYLLPDLWEHARELPGIGEYGAAAWEIFCQGVFSAEPPKDHALVQYWEWYRDREKNR